MPPNAPQSMTIGRLTRAVGVRVETLRYYQQGGCRVLLDAEMQAPVVAEIREVIAESPIAAKINDLHVWRVGKNKYACILGLSTAQTVEPDYFRKQLSIHEELVHITVEINTSKLI